MNKRKQETPNFFKHIDYKKKTTLKSSKSLTDIKYTTLSKILLTLLWPLGISFYYGLILAASCN